MWAIDPWLALGVLVSTAATDAVYVMFNAAVSSRKRLPAATWSSIWYLLSAFAVISYTKNWIYVRICRCRFLGGRLPFDDVIASLASNEHNRPRAALISHFAPDPWTCTGCDCDPL